MDGLVVMSCAGLLGIFAMFAFIVSFVLGLIIWLRQQRKNMLKTHREAWSRIAEELGLKYQADHGDGVIEGLMHGVWVRIDIDLVKLGDSETTHTRVRCFHHPVLELGLSVSKETLISKFGQVLGAHELKTGDAEFDNAFLIRGDRPEPILRLLDTNVRRWIMHCASHHELTIINDEGIECHRVGRVKTAQEVLPIVHDQLALILAMRRVLPSVQAQPEAVAIEHVR